MIGFLVVVMLAVLVIRWVVLHNRFHDLEERIALLSGFAVRQSQVKELTDRLIRLEQSVAELRMRAAPVVERTEPIVAAPQPVVQLVAPPRIAPPIAQPTAPVVTEAAVAPPPAEIPVFAPVPWTRPVIVPPSAPQPAAPSSGDRLRAFLGNDEWEALLGGSLLNKVGAVVLVIGIALFLAYSFGRMSAAGRASLAISASAAILGAGIWAERRAPYRLFARGLIGAGWAALYATAYAIYALPAARIIENPFAGSIVLLLVAAGMIGHSLRYRAQAVTATAYFAAFAALAATPSTPFAVVSLVPLAASLLYLANRFEWNSMALFGLVATYATCIARGSSDAPLPSTQSLFLAYWLLFEAFDLLRVRSGAAPRIAPCAALRKHSAGAEFIAPLNAAAFLALSYMAWSQKAPEMLWLAAAYGAALYLGDAIVRAMLLPPSALEPDADLAARLRQGSYEFSLVLAAVLGGLAIVGKVPGVWSSVGLAAEAELLYLAGVRFRAGFMRGCGMAAFVFSLGRLATQDSSNGHTAVLGHATWNWTPPALFHAFLFYVNRVLKQPNALASSMATALVAATLAAEIPERYVGASWLLFALILLELGLRKRLREFRLQAYTLAVAGAAASAYVHIASHVNMSWEGLALSLAAAYACALRSRWHSGALDQDERDFFATGASVATAALAAILIWNTVPAAYVALAWILLALVLFEAGNRALIRELRTMSWAIAAFGASALIGMHAEHFVKFPSVEVWASYLAACLAAWAMTARAVVWPPANLGAGERGAFADLMSAAGVFAAMAFVWLVLPDPLVTPAWAALGMAMAEIGVLASTASLGFVATAVLALTLARALTFDMGNAALWNGLSERVLSTLPPIAALYSMAYRVGARIGGRIGRAYLWAASATAAILIAVEMPGVRVPLGWTAFSLALLAVGLRFRVRDLRVQGYVLAVLAFPLALADTYPPQVSICAAIVAGFYAAEYLIASARLAGKEHNAATMFSLFGTVLLAALLYGRVSGGLFTVALGLEGLALLGAGFPLRERILRLQGLALLLACILKLFVYDLRNLETMYRILSFIALGLIMLSVSWIYTRFREHIRRLL
jgi:hypothetical protein